MNSELQSTIIEPPSGQGSFVFPVTFAQQRLWFLDQLHPGDTSYLIPWNIRLTGELNVNALCAALNEVVARHETLRTTFALVDGEVSQVIAEQLVIPVPVVDLSGRPNPGFEAERLAAEEAHKPIDLANGPLVRAQLLRLSSADHVFLLTLHHIIFDRWSRGILTRELAALYGAFLEGKPSPLGPLALQYADYAVWQRDYLKGEVLEEQLGYWKTQLAGAPAELGLPTDRPRPAVMTFRGAEKSFRFSESLARKLNEFAQGHGATLFMTLLAGFQALLSRYTGLDDVMVGTPIFNRNRTELESIIGFFANTLALRLDLSGDPPFAELVQRAKNVALGAYEHQDLPFDRIVQEINPERSLSLNPLFQVAFSLGNVPRHTFELPGLDVHLGGTSDKTAKFDLSMILRPQGESLSGVIEYSTDLFDEATISRMLGHFENLLTAAVTDPSVRISELPLISEAEKRQLLTEFNTTAADYRRSCCFHELFEERAALSPPALAISFDGNELSYGELNGRANQLARHLRRMGIGHEALVGICLDRSAEAFIAILGVMKAGGAYVPLDPAYPADRLAFMQADSGIRALITSAQIGPVLPENGIPRVRIDADWPQISVQSRENAEPVARPESLAYVIYTSGSTGRPKGVLVEHHGLCNVVAEQVRRFGAGPGSRILQFASISFDASVFETAMALGTGGALFLGDRVTLMPGPGLADFVRRHRITAVTLPPSALSHLPSTELPSLRVVTVAGEPCPPELVNEWGGDSRRFFNLYGPTEATIWSTTAECVPGAGKPPIGRPVSNCIVHILDRHLQPVPVGVPGEIYIAGAGIARGYLNRPDLTAERFIAHPFQRGKNARLYKTGDLGRYLAGGDIDYLGRSDDQVKLRGYRIELGEIEAAIGQHPGVRENVAILRQDSPGNARLVSYIVPRAGAVPTNELRKLLLDRLPEYMVPSAFVSMERLPLTPNGKVNRRELPGPRVQLNEEYEAPRTPLEARLASIWAEVLRVPRIGVHDDFFESGGYSLLAVDLFSRIEKEIGQKLPLGLLFDARTISAIAARMDQTEWQPAETSVKPLRTGGSRPPIYAAYGLGATVLTFRNLSRHLDPDQPIYCLEALGVDSGWNSLEQLAAIYVRDMLAFQPQGPYHLMGASFGGMVVYEIARQLQAQGHEVGLVGLLDSYNMGDRNVQPRSERIDKQMGFIKRRVNTHMRRLLTRRPSQWPRYIVGRFLAIGRLTEGALWRVIYRSYRTTPKKKPAMLRNLIRVYELAGMDYVPQSYPGKLVLFRSERKASQEVIARLIRRQHGWIGLAKGGLEIIDVPGDHHTMLQEPHVAVLVQEISDWIARYAAEKAGAVNESAAGDLSTMAAGRK